MPDVQFTPQLPSSLVYGLAMGRQMMLAKHAFFHEASLPDAGSIIDHYEPLRSPFLLAHYRPPAGYQERFDRSFSVHEKYKEAYQFAHSASMDGQYAKVAISVRRKCKAGLCWAREYNIPVHFITDGIDMQAVVDKRVYPSGEPATGSELRWVYRNRHDVVIDATVQFWHDGQRVAPPWVSHPDIWSSYHPKSLFPPPPVDLPVQHAGSSPTRIARRRSESTSEDLGEILSGFF